MIPCSAWSYVYRTFVWASWWWVRTTGAWAALRWSIWFCIPAQTLICFHLGFRGICSSAVCRIHCNYRFRIPTNILIRFYFRLYYIKCSAIWCIHNDNLLRIPANALICLHICLWYRNRPPSGAHYNVRSFVTAGFLRYRRYINSPYICIPRHIRTLCLWNDSINAAKYLLDCHPYVIFKKFSYNLL